MTNWPPTFALFNGAPPETRPAPEDYEGWSIAELYAGRRLPPSAAASPSSTSFSGDEAATAASLPSWLADAQWQATPGRLPELPPTAEMRPFERAAIPDSHRRRSQMGRPFLDEAPQDYPSFLQHPGWSGAGRSIINHAGRYRETNAWPAHLVRPASPEGTPNEATPSGAAYNIAAGLAALGSRFAPYEADIRRIGPAKSYLTRDQSGMQVVVNVTEPGHPLYPGVVIRSVTESPSGATIWNEGTGRGRLQGPDGPAFVRNWGNNWVWDGQAQEILDRHRARRPRR